MGGIIINDSDFQRAIQAANEQAKRNTLMFAESAAHEFHTTAKAQAPWTDNRGIARARLYASASQSGDRTSIELGGSAPNYRQYKKARKRYPDYMELLEFAHGGRFAIVFPMAEALTQTIREKFGDAALNGNTRVKIQRSKSAARERARDSRRRGR